MLLVVLSGAFLMSKIYQTGAPLSSCACKTGAGTVKNSNMVSSLVVAPPWYLTWCLGFVVRLSMARNTQQSTLFCQFLIIWSTLLALYGCSFKSNRVGDNRRAPSGCMVRAYIFVVTLMCFLLRFGTMAGLKHRWLASQSSRWQPPLIQKHPTTSTIRLTPSPWCV